MNKNIQQVNVVARNPWFLVANGFSSLAAFMWFIYGQTVGVPNPFSITVLLCTLTLLILGYIYSLKVRSENIALRGVAEIFFEINRIYQKTLSDLFGSDTRVNDSVALVYKEEQVLKAVCQRASIIFSHLSDRSCMVTVKLVTTKDGICCAHTYVRSQELCGRDFSGRIHYTIGTGANNGFDTALAKRPDGIPSHFFSADLRESDGYTNKREDYLKHYKSTLVVPIRGDIDTDGSESTSSNFDLIGFLCVDTLSVNRLNNGYHLYMLSALASQMYNFMSLMRGRYIVSGENEGEIAYGLP